MKNNLIWIVTIFVGLVIFSITLYMSSHQKQEQEIKTDVKDSLSTPDCYHGYLMVHGSDKQLFDDNGKRIPCSG